MIEVIQESGNILLLILLTGLLLPLSTFIGVLVGTILKHVLSYIKDEALRKKASELILWASQKLTGGGRGKEKFSKVFEKLSRKFTRATPEQIEESIEAGIKALKLTLKNTDNNFLSILSEKPKKSTKK